MKHVFRILPGVVALFGLSAALAAQAKVTLVPRYVPGTHLYYSVLIHATITSRATLDTKAEVEMTILPGAQPANFTAALRFTRFATTVQAAQPDDQAALTVQAATTDRAALTMEPARFAISPGGVKILARAAGPQYDQPVDMLEELARTDNLPSGAVAVGGTWTRHSNRPIPTVSATVPVTTDCTLASVGAAGADPTVTIHEVSNGDADLPADSLPGASTYTAQGLTVEAHISIQAEATAVYRLSDAVVEQITSESHNRLLIKLIGPNPQAGTSATESVSRATVKLERAVPAKA